VFDLAAGCARFALAGQDDGTHTEIAQRLFDCGFAVAAIGGHRPGWTSGAAGDPPDGGFEHRRVGWVADLDGVVHDHAVFVVDDLGLVTELDGTAEAALADRSRVGVVQRHDPGRTIGRDALDDPLAGLGSDLFHPFGQHYELIHDRPLAACSLLAEP